MNILIVVKLFLKYVLTPIVNVILSVCVLGGGTAFIVLSFGGWMPGICSSDGISCYSFMLTMAFGSIVLVLGVLTRILIHFSPKLDVYKKNLYRGLALGYGKIRYFVDPIGLTKEIYLANRTNSNNRKVYFISKIIYHMAKYSAIAAMIFLLLAILSATIAEI